ncbi:MAG TPA: gliding motility protein GldL [Bacteroidales bacterium]|nr:gliding motility protein GldL [Bacteroidales bacterium]
MANLADIVESSGWKKFMAKLYGWGASIVIIGALFKIQHWKFAGLFLTIGLLTEAVIFFFSAFEPLHEELDWTLVYPELAGMSEQEEMEEMKGIGTGVGGRPLERIENLLGEANIGEDTLKNIGSGLQKLNVAASGIAEISGATAATKEFLKNITDASGTVGTMNEVYSSTTQSIKESAGSLASAYLLSADQVAKSGGEVAGSYMKIAETIKGEHELIAQSGKVHEQHLESLNKNLSALNAVYELQAKEGSEHLKGSQKVYSGIEEMVLKLKDSIEETGRYKEEIVKLRDNLSSLNNIYGNMLSAMNVIIKK